MPVFKNRLVLEVARGVKAFLTLEAGLTRGPVPAQRDGLHPRSPEAKPPVFFVVGQPRSGTTWLMRLLNSHPEILCLGEGRFFGRDWREPQMRKLPVNKQPSSLYNALSSSEYLRFWVERSVWSKDKDPDEHINNLTRMAIDYFMTRKLSETGKRIVGDKTPLLTPNVVREISELYPEAKVIHIIRDGRDQAVSLMHYLWNTARSEGGLYHVEPEELEKRNVYRKAPQELLETGEGIFTEERLRRMATNWSDRVAKNSRDGRTLLGGNYTEVRYEDLLARPEEEAERLLKFLGARANERTVKRCVEKVSFERRAKGRKKGEEDPSSVSLRKGISGDWKNVFTERDKQIFKEIAGDALIEVGYEKNADW